MLKCYFTKGVYSFTLSTVYDITVIQHWQKCSCYQSLPCCKRNTLLNSKKGPVLTNFLTRFWIWGPKERESSIKIPRYLYLDTNSISKPWRVVIEHEFECADFLFVNIISFEQVLNRSVYAELQIEDDSEPDPMLVQKSKSPYHQRTPV